MQNFCFRVVIFFDLRKVGFRLVQRIVFEIDCKNLILLLDLAFLLLLLHLFFLFFVLWLKGKVVVFGVLLMVKALRRTPDRKSVV
mgnify:CR=1 FL=1